ncbi:MAG: selenide, water dikinase SelD, partial [Anaerolineae bacterium]|nr:selenide, water dikinase SelD [Anaerolineae bacterium]
FFTPIVDDPYQYGAIAAANALSDVYAMGGRPLLALNIAALPPTLPPEMIAQIMVGLAEKVREAGAVIAGGHTIQDKEPKVGLAVVGLASPNRLLTKGGARPGDWLILTKPLGTGCITTAAKSDQARPDDLVEAAAWMMRLNRDAAEVAEGVGARAATDITGFGLLGHATELAEASGVTLHLDAAQMPLLPGAEQYATAWIFPGGSAANREAYQRGVRVVGDLPEHRLMLLFDAQTSGGLLIALPPDQREAFAAQMAGRQAPWWDVGQVGPREDVPLVVHA